MEEHQKQIEQLERKVNQTNDERSILRERLIEVELELSEAAKYRAMLEQQLQELMQERHMLVEQKTSSVDR